MRYVTKPEVARAIFVDFFDSLLGGFGVKIAKEAEFFSFGTNDLTQMTFGYSRDDVGKFLPVYLSKGILQHDPFEVCCFLL